MMNCIHQILKNKNMTQADLAGMVGIKREYLNKIMNSHVTPTVVLAMKISRSLDMKVEEVFSGSGELKSQEEQAVTALQDKIIDFMMQEGISYTDVIQAVCNNEKFIDRLMYWLKSRPQ